MANLTTYLAWLNWLIALGTNAGPFIALLMELFERLKPMIPALPGTVPGDDGGLAITQQLEHGVIGKTQAITEGGQELVADVLEAEGNFLSLIASDSAEGSLSVRDLSRLRALFAFLQSSGLLDVFTKLFAGT